MKRQRNALWISVLEPLQSSTHDVDPVAVFPPEVFSGGLVDTSDVTLETLLRTVVMGHRLI